MIGPLHTQSRALALALSDAPTRAAERASGLLASAATAIVTIGHTPGLTIANVARVAGVSHSVMVRIAEGLKPRSRVAADQGRSCAAQQYPCGARGCADAGFGQGECSGAGTHRGADADNTDGKPPRG